jgi:hypothetical protein
MNIKPILSLACLSLVTVSCASRLASLPADYSLGASSLAEREEICEAVVRHIASNHPTEHCFIGFENVVQGRTVHHNPTDDLLHRLRDVKGRVAPVSQAKGVRVEDGAVVEYEHPSPNVIHWLWGMNMISKDSAAFYVLENSTLYCFEVLRSCGKWITVKEQALSYF